MYDRFSRKINYLRISVTDRCNYRCVYCMPAAGVAWVPRKNILSFEEIFEATATAVDLGIDKVRLTGGEPLVRRGIERLVAMLAGIKAIRDLAMTTNGSLLEEYASRLIDAGLHRVNISLDTVDPQRYRELTRGGDLQRVLAGIEAARDAGLTPIKLNCVVQNSSAEADARAVAAFGKSRALEVRFIRQMNMEAGEFWPVEGGTGGDCRQCNRLRLSSEGLVRPCLFSDLAFSVRQLGARRAMAEAVAAKPQSGQTARNHTFYSIGG